MFAAQNVVTGSVRLVKLEAPWPMLVCHCAEFKTMYLYPPVSSSGGDTTVSVLTMAKDTFDCALFFFDHMENNGVCTTDFHDYGVQVYVEKIENSVRCLSLSVKRTYYSISRKI